MKQKSFTVKGQQLEVSYEVSGSTEDWWKYFGKEFNIHINGYKPSYKLIDIFILLTEEKSPSTAIQIFGYADKILENPDILVFNVVDIKRVNMA